MLVSSLRGKASFNYNYSPTDYDALLSLLTFRGSSKFLLLFPKGRDTPWTIEVLCRV